MKGISWMIAFALICVSSFSAAPAGPSPSAEAAIPAVAVQYQGKDLFLVRTRVASFTPEARAKAIETRMERVMSAPFSPVPVLTANVGEHLTDIMAGETVLMTITEDDAAAEGASRAELARRRMAALQSALQNQSWVSRVKSLGLSLLWTLLVTVGGMAVYRGVRLGYRRLRDRVSTISEARFPRVRIQRLELLSTARMRRLVLKGVTVLQWILLGAAGYIYLSIIFSFFPATRGLAERLFHLALGPLSIIWQSFTGYLPSFFILVLIALSTRYLLKLIHLLFRGLQSGLLRIPNFHPDWSEPTYRLSRLFVFAFALVVAFPYLPGSGSDAFKGVSIFFGLVFSLGSSGVVGNAVAGILITYMRPFHMGDRIAVGDTVGDVVEKSLLVTRIRTIKNVDVIIPNAALLGSKVENYSANAKTCGLILHTTVTIGYDAPWQTVHTLLIDAAVSTEGVLAEPKPFVLQTSLDDFYVSYQINAYTNQASRMAVIYSELHANIQEKFNEGGVEIMSPHYRAERDGNQTTIPTQHLPEDYIAPSFRVTRT